jgi:hypothetical protein
LGTELDGVAVVVFAFDKSFLGLFAAGDVDQGDGDADDLISLVAGGLIGDEKGAHEVRLMRIGTPGFEFAVTLALEGVLEVWLPFGELFRAEHLSDVAAEVGCDRKIVNLRESLVDADVAEVAIDIAKADGDTVVDCVELGEALGGERFEAEGLAGVDGGSWLGVWGRMEPFGKGFGEMFGRDGAAVEPALTDVAAQPKEHVGDVLRFDPFGDGGKAEAVAEADDGGGDLSAVPGMGHGADEASVDLELVEGQELEVAEAGIAGAEVVEREAGTLFLQLGRDSGGVFGVVDEGAFCDLEDEAVEGEICVLGGGADVSWESEVG